MNWTAYLDYFNSIVDATDRTAPYDNDDYYQYTKLNKSRNNRWLKHSPLTKDTISYIVNEISQPQQWVVITEPWCGDAAHIVPVLYLMSELNPLISFTLQLRDIDSEIEQYLTNGSKSIPILIVRDEAGKDLFHWGPRSKEGTILFEQLKADQASFDDMKIALQEFYNADKGIGVQEEVVALLQATQ
ncbi:MAG: thioredoxin family protein [Niabella sp.]